MNRIEQMEEQLALGTINDVDLEILYDYYREEGARIWHDFIYEKDKARKEVLRKKRDEFEKKDNNFLSVYLDFMIFKLEEDRT